MDRNGWVAAATLALAAGWWAAGQAPAQAQTYDPKPRGKTTAPKSDYSVSRGRTMRRPPKFDYYYYQPRNGYTLSPFIVSRPVQRQPIVLGPVRPYTEEQYAQLVIASYEATRMEPATSRLPVQSVVQEVTREDGTVEYALAAARVADVLDRGTLTLDNREQVKLRGARVPSENDPNDITRMFAREAAQTVRRLTENETVYIMFQDPLRNNEGTILGTFYLRDGTNLNRLLIRKGLARIEPTDFFPDEDLTSLRQAEEAAREEKLGIWSR
ncbi:MAG: thermonuclease family protein [Candidatus Sumerlaeaceae bacterium]|nr:thermonuclease family protein [Candidatus Sumerlaeaceae bacterium]